MGVLGQQRANEQFALAVDDAQPVLVVGELPDAGFETCTVELTGIDRRHAVRSDPRTLDNGSLFWRGDAVVLGESPDEPLTSVSAPLRRDECASGSMAALFDGTSDFVEVPVDGTAGDEDGIASTDGRVAPTPEPPDGRATADATS